MLSRARIEMMRGLSVFPCEDVLLGYGSKTPAPCPFDRPGDCCRRVERVARPCPECWGPLLLDSLKTKLFLASGVSNTEVAHNLPPGPRSLATSDLLISPAFLTAFSRTR